MTFKFLSFLMRTSQNFVPSNMHSNLINIEKYHVYIKTTVHNEPVVPFSMDLTKDIEAINKLRNPKVAEMIKQLSRLKYGKDREIVEAEIAQRARL